MDKTIRKFETTREKNYKDSNLYSKQPYKDDWLLYYIGKYPEIFKYDYLDKQCRACKNYVTVINPCRKLSESGNKCILGLCPVCNAFIGIKLPVLFPFDDDEVSGGGIHPDVPQLNSEELK